MLTDAQHQKLERALRVLGTVQSLRQGLYLAMNAGDGLDAALSNRLGAGHATGSAANHLMSNMLSQIPETRRTVLMPETMRRLENIRQSVTDTDVAELERISRTDSIALPAWTEEMSDTQLLQYVTASASRDEGVNALFQQVGIWFQQKGVL